MLYLIKTCLYILAFYVPFVLVFNRTTFFTLNRVYLVAGLLFSLLLPLYEGLTTISSYSPPDLYFIEPIAAQTELVLSKATESTSSMDVNAIAFIIYLVGIAVRMTVLALSIAGILKLRRQGEMVKYKGLTVLKTNTVVPFSFFKYVFLPNAVNDTGILEHEAAHVRQRHWIDLVIVELVSTLLWFNPVMIFYKRSLKQQHEYLADHATLKNGIGMGEYLLSIRQQFEFAIPSPLTSEFYFQSIKNRIDMLTKKSTPMYRAAMYGAVLPVIICLLMAFSPRQHFHVVNQNEKDSIQDPLSLGLPIDKKNNFLLESLYGERMHPILKVVRMHTGIDLSAEEGVPVVSTRDGVVVKAVMADAWGNIVVIQHDGTYSTSYSHLKSMNVREGDKVGKGEQIGVVGHTGMSTRDHLHFELLKNGDAIDPIEYLPGIK